MPTPVNGVGGARAITAIAEKVNAALIAVTAFGVSPREVRRGGEPPADRPVDVDRVGRRPWRPPLLGGREARHDLGEALLRRRDRCVSRHSALIVRSGAAAPARFSDWSASRSAVLDVWTVYGK